VDLLKSQTKRVRRGNAPAAVLVLAAAMALTTSMPAGAAGPKFWDWPEGRSFDEVTLSGAGRDTLGGLEAGPIVTVHALPGPEVVWRLAADGRGGWYLGTGHGGEIHHVAPDGKMRLVARLESTEVFSLAVLPGGDLLAGGGPDGRLLRVTAAGDVTEVGRIEGAYIWGMAVQEKAGVAWLAVGAPAAVYRYGWRDGKLEKVASLSAQNAMDVVFDSERSRLLVATQGPGLVYALTDDGRSVRLLGDIAQDEARRLLRGPGGAIHVLGLAGGAEAMATAGDVNGSGDGGPAQALIAALAGDVATASLPAAALYRLDVDDQGHEVLLRTWAGDRDLMAAGWSERWGWLGAGSLAAGDGAEGDGGADATAATSAQARLYRLLPPWGVAPLTTWTGGDVLDLAIAGDDLALAQAHPAALVLADRSSDANGTAVSPPLDGGPGVRWGRLRWDGNAGDDAPRWSVRGGRRPQPDDTWTAWSSGWSGHDQEIALADCRYMQWRVELPAPARGARAAHVASVSVSAWQPNRAPVIEEFRLEQLRGVKLGGLAAGESIIHEYRSGLRAEFTTQDAPSDGWSGLERADPGRAVRVVTWRASDPNQDRLEFRLECRRDGETAWRPAVAPGGAQDPVSGNLGSWDTSALADGRYALRLVASDAPDNPSPHAAQALRVLGPVTVDNTPPRLEVLETGTADGDLLTVRLRAVDATSPLAGARVIAADGRAERLDPRDGICDGLEETFLARIERRRAMSAHGDQPLRVRLEVRDLAGNIAGVEAVWP
jgi:hypothetical protein